MPEENLIPAAEFCIHYQIEVSFLYSLHDLGLISLSVVQEQAYIDAEELAQLEKMIRLHELDINPEGIDALTAMSLRMEALQRELTTLRNRLRRYEG
jgi:hypothetical protein